VFREQLIKDMEADTGEYGAKLNAEYVAQVKQVEELRRGKAAEFDRMIVWSRCN
jgi:hypothetical protein